MLQTPESSRLTNRRGTNKRKQPAEGTKLRELWDLFQANRGRPVDVRFPNRSGKGYTNRQRDDLVDYYGLDIRPAGRGLWLLAGRWVGDQYEDYTQAKGNQ